MSEWTKERIEKLKKNSAIGVFGSYSLGVFYKGHKNINRFGVNVIDVNLNLTGGDNLFARDLVELLNESLSMVNEIERLQSEVATLRSQQAELMERQGRWIPINEVPQEGDGKMYLLADFDSAERYGCGIPATVGWYNNLSNEWMLPGGSDLIVTGKQIGRAHV